jgi:hypothetical protein
MHYILDSIPHHSFPSLSGADIIALMRKYHITIHQLAHSNGLTKKRVRELRMSGVSSGFPSWEIHKLIEVAIRSAS